ncbi:MULTISPECIES: YbjN domain-containing protein [Corallincola]|uniref:YbjN domain-containing protein n=3 Tax=Corallincola TaxID=1775176 RepID=A0A368NJC8_9GAMM|nr:MULTISPECIES: YbjN domain-containing protein [Corallincola]RCU50548.1 YbjN domain-containing protein [Corallincola holothuriorum]TAA48445.1 YbjN domain-containing protein [Corallincola spongiicola]TCI01872.1 YbjN domain-containing protein [Corallincola luteus]
MVDTLIRPDRDQIQHWLDSFSVETYLCDNCQAIHLTALQRCEGVMEARLFTDPEWVLLSCEAELKPTGLLPLLGEMGNLNATYPTTKIFVDIQDSTLPRLVVSQSLYVGAGVTLKQFEHFFTQTSEIIEQVVGECNDNGVLMPNDEEAPVEASSTNTVH